jgi:hypothetical protein
MNRRKEIRTVTRTTQVRIEFTLADLRRRLRLPENAVLSTLVQAGDGKLPPVFADYAIDQPLVVTFEKTTTEGGGK